MIFREKKRKPLLFFFLRTAVISLEETRLDRLYNGLCIRFSQTRNGGAGGGTPAELSSKISGRVVGRRIKWSCMGVPKVRTKQPGGFWWYGMLG